MLKVGKIHGLLTRKRRLSSKGTLPGPSRPRFVAQGDGSLFVAQGELISLAGHMRSAGCRLPSLASSAEKEAYAKVAVAGSKVVAQKAKVAALEVERDRHIRRASCIARRDIEQRPHRSSERAQGRGPNHRRRACSLKEIEGDCEDLVALAAVPDWSISELDLPQISEDSVDQVGGSYSYRISITFRNIFVSLFFGILFAHIVEIRRGLDLYKALLCLRIYHSALLNFVFACQGNMASRRSNPHDSDRVQTRTGSVNTEHIRSGDVSEALTEVLREETRHPRASAQEVKGLEGEKSASRVKSSSPTGLEGRDRPPKKAKTNGSDHRLGVLGEAAVAKPFHWQFSHSKDFPITDDPVSVTHLVRHFKRFSSRGYVNMAVAHAKPMEANNAFAATLEKCLQDVPRSGEIYKIKKVVRELKLAKVESSANKFSDDLRRATYDAKKALAYSYLDVLVSLKEKWEKKKAATDCETRLRDVCGFFKRLVWHESSIFPEANWKC
ncbi:hypothetical protein F2Q69_00046393 [Brassica cretica]|uniref:Uncharacterized protein n=1 Tax=Brassica cretica TaxID=69181 RepID=A0A8S9PNU8_BRACR|nr:hypothetical protein F2Q69_00046393 [Brassica cretica]